VINIWQVVPGEVAKIISVGQIYPHVLSLVRVLGTCGGGTWVTMAENGIKKVYRAVTCL